MERQAVLAGAVKAAGQEGLCFLHTEQSPKQGVRPRAEVSLCRGLPGAPLTTGATVGDAPGG